MTLGRLWAGMAPRIGRTLGSTAAHPERGERVTLRRPSTLEDLQQEGSPGTLQLASAALAGAATLSLELPAGTPMAGTLLAGARLTIGGEEYTLAADATAAGVLLAVTLTEGLADPAAEGASATVHPEVVFTLENCRVSKRMRKDLTRPLQADHIATVFVPVAGAPTTPRMNDLLVLEDGTPGRVANTVISGGGFWRLQMGA